MKSYGNRRFLPFLLISFGIVHIILLTRVNLTVSSISLAKFYFFFQNCLLKSLLVPYDFILTLRVPECRLARALLGREIHLYSVGYV